MIVLETEAGLANRMRAIASAFTLANELNTKLVVIWPMDDSLNCDFFSLFAPIKGVLFITGKSLFKRALRKMCKLQCKHTFIRATAADAGQIAAATREGSVYIRTCYQFYPVNGYQCFQPVDSVLEKVRMILPQDCSDLIGIHIRRTDNTESISRSPTELFERAIETEIEKNPNVRFYLATDSAEEQQRLISIFGTRIIVNADKTISRTTQQGMVDALVDMVCLSRTAKIFGSYWSSFSETAAALGETEVIVLQNPK